MMLRLGDVFYRSALTEPTAINPALSQLADRASKLKADSFGDEFGTVRWYTTAQLEVLRDMQSLARSGVEVRLHVHQLSVLVWAVVAYQLDCPVSGLGVVLAELEGYGLDGWALLEWLGVMGDLALQVAA
jgi:hypothetical protein